MTAKLIDETIIYDFKALHDRIIRFFADTHTEKKHYIEHLGILRPTFNKKLKECTMSSDEMLKLVKEINKTEKIIDESIPKEFDALHDRLLLFFKQYGIDKKHFYQYMGWQKLTFKRKLKEHTFTADLMLKLVQEINQIKV